MGGANPSYSQPNRYLGQAAKQLGINVNDYDRLDQAGDYARAFERSLNDPLYLNAAKGLGISDYNSINDYAKVLASLTIGGGGGGGGDSRGGGGGSGLPRANNGSYDNIIGNLGAQAAQGQDAAKQYDNQQVDIAASLQAQSDAAMALMKAQSEAQAKALNDLMIQQDSAYQQQLAMQQQQIEASNAALAEQRRQSDALSRAYVPMSQATATAPVINGYSGAGQNRNTLSALSIKSGKSLATSSLAGLQIA